MNKRNTYVWSSGNPRLIECHKENTLIRRRTFCTTSDQSLEFLSHMSICRKHLSRLLQSVHILYEYNYMERADIGLHCLLSKSKILPDDAIYIENIYTSYPHKVIIVSDQSRHSIYMKDMWKYTVLYFSDFFYIRTILSRLLQNVASVGNPFASN